MPFDDSDYMIVKRGVEALETIRDSQVSYDEVEALLNPLIAAVNRLGGKVESLSVGLDPHYKLKRT